MWITFHIKCTVTTITIEVVLSRNGIKHFLHQHPRYITCHSVFNSDGRPTFVP